MGDAQSNNPLDMLQGLWGQMGFQLPGMVAPTLDEDDLEKQIRDLRSVENWLRMNLSMLQITIQNLEMQKTALSTFRSMGEFGKAVSGADGKTSASSRSLNSSTKKHSPSTTPRKAATKKTGGQKKSTGKKLA